MGLRARLVLVAVVAVLGLFPVALERDSYPISTFPMFARDRPRIGEVDTAEAVGSTVHRLSPQRIAATPEPVTAAVVVSGAIARGEASQLCAEIARRVARQGPADARTIEVVSEKFDAVSWFDGRRTPIDRVVHATCDVPR